MKNTNRKRTLLISGAIILLCMIIIVSTSWALFTDRKAVTTHLRAGDLEITLERIGLSKSILNEKGYLEVKEYTPEEAYFDFSKKTDENVFDLEDTDKLIPSCQYTAKMRISNNSSPGKSNIAYAYWIEVVYNGPDGAKLAEQIKVTVDAGGENKSEDNTFLIDGVQVGSKEKPIGVLAINEKAAFTVTIEFLNLSDEVNDKAQADAVSFDLVVHAVQATTLPTP